MSDLIKFGQVDIRQNFAPYSFDNNKQDCF